VRVLTIGGIPISVESSDLISQTYAPIGGGRAMRLMNGGLVMQRNWRKLKTTISVSDARFLPAIHALDLDVPHVIQCLTRRQIAGDSNAITLPPARRADIDPLGYAVMPNGFMQRTASVLAGDTLTLVAVPGALRYTATYVPELVVLVTDLNEHGDVRSARMGWELTAEEI
jgi:hypothetical protein